MLDRFVETKWANVWTRMRVVIQARTVGVRVEDFVLVFFLLRDDLVDFRRDRLVPQQRLDAHRKWFISSATALIRIEPKRHV